MYGVFTANVCYTLLGGFFCFIFGILTRIFINRTKKSNNKNVFDKSNLENEEIKMLFVARTDTNLKKNEIIARIAQDSASNSDLNRII